MCKMWQSIETWLEVHNCKEERKMMTEEWLKDEWLGEISIQRLLGEIKKTLGEIQTDLVQINIALGINNPALPEQDAIDEEFEKMESDYWEGVDNK